MSPSATHETLHVRFGDTTEELDDDHPAKSPTDTQVLPLAQYLFDFVATAVPMKKLHPRFVQADAEADAAGTADADVRLIYSASTDEGAADTDRPDNEPPADPRWAALRNLN